MEKKKLEQKITEIDKLVEETYEKKNGYIIYDGIVDVDEYLKSKFKILWVLKEPHDKGGAPDGWDMRDLINNYSKTENGLNPDMKATFTSIIYTTQGILNDQTFGEIPYVRDDHNSIDILKSIALINIKKLPAGVTSPDKVIEEAYNKYKSVIIKQITDYEPDIVICGNTFKFLREDLINQFGLKEPKSQNYPTDHYFSDKMLVIDTFHPANTSVTHAEYFEGIIDAVKKWIKNKNN